MKVLLLTFSAVLSETVAIFLYFGITPHLPSARPPAQHLATLPPLSHFTALPFSGSQLAAASSIGRRSGPIKPWLLIWPTIKRGAWWWGGVAWAWPPPPPSLEVELRSGYVTHGSISRCLRRGSHNLYLSWKHLAERATDVNTPSHACTR